MSNAIKLQLVTAVVMAVAATPQYPADMSGHAEGVTGFEVTNPDLSKTWFEQTAYLAMYENFDKLNFAQAMHLAANGHRIACRRWESILKNISLGTTFPTMPPLNEIGDGTATEHPVWMVEEAAVAYFDITTEKGAILNNWIPNHYDLQCDVWYVWTQELADAEIVQWEIDHPNRLYADWILIG